MSSSEIDIIIAQSEASILRYCIDNFVKKADCVFIFLAFFFAMLPPPPFMLTTDHQHNHCYLQLSICQNIVVLDGLSKAPNLLRKDGDSKIVPFNIEVIFGRRPSIALFFVFQKPKQFFWWSPPQ